MKNQLRKIDTSKRTLARAEELFSVGKKAIIDNRNHPLLEPRMTFNALKLMSGRDPDSIALIDFLGDEDHTQDIIAALGLDYDFHGIRNPTHAEIEKLIDIQSIGLKTTADKPVYLPLELAQILAEIGQKFEQLAKEDLIICSGFRSSAYQLYLLCYYGYNGNTLADVHKTAGTLGSSEHEIAANPAVDIENFCQRFSGQDIATIRASERYKIFTELAGKSITETFPEGPNNDGQGEPWHFRRKEAI